MRVVGTVIEACYRRATGALLSKGSGTASSSQCTRSRGDANSPRHSGGIRPKVMSAFKALWEVAPLALPKLEPPGASVCADIFSNRHKPNNDTGGEFHLPSCLAVVRRSRAGREETRRPHLTVLLPTSTPSVTPPPTGLRDPRRDPACGSRRVSSGIEHGGSGRSDMGLWCPRASGAGVGWFSVDLSSSPNSMGSRKMNSPPVSLLGLPQFMTVNRGGGGGILQAYVI